MLLGADEHLLRSAYAVVDPHHRPDGVRGPGVLYLTNRRLRFEARATTGLVRDLLHGPETVTVFDGPLSDLTDVRVRSSRFGRAWLVVETYHARPAFDVLDPQAWLGAIAQAKRALPPPGPPGPVLIERHVVKVRCRYCGNLTDELAGKCASCGAKL